VAAKHTRSGKQNEDRHCRDRADNLPFVHLASVLTSMPKLTPPTSIPSRRDGGCKSSRAAYRPATQKACQPAGSSPESLLSSGVTAFHLGLLGIASSRRARYSPLLMFAAQLHFMCPGATHRR
jgi:hypothetical protein